MKNTATKFAAFCLLNLVMFSHLAHAVVVAGANGGADNSFNTTRQQLEALPTVSDGFFLDNVVQYGPGNAVYLGYDPNNGNPIAWALTGMHLGNQGTVTIQSISYLITQRIPIDGSDLALLRLSQDDNLMPTLRPLTLSSTPLTNNTDVIMIGHGRSRVQNATTDANTSDAVSVTDGTGYTTSSTRQLRWGTNSSSNFTAPGTPGPTRSSDIGGRETIVGRTVFDQPSPGEWLTTTQAQGVGNDSGGGVFGHDGTILGIMVAVEAPNANQARFGNSTLFADIASYKDLIDDQIGVMLIPEPSTVSLLLLLCGGYLVARKCKKDQEHNN